MGLLTAVALGALIGLFLGALGGGGSILTVPALVFVLGEPARAATTESLVIVGVTALTAAVAHARAERVRWGAGLAFGAAGVAASYAGTKANCAVDPNILLLAFAGLLLAAAVAVLARQRARAATVAAPTTPLPPRPLPAGGVAVLDAPVSTRPADGDNRPARTSAGRLVGAGLLVGFLTGFFGVGGGFVIVPALVMLLGFAMPVAVGTSLAVIALNSAAALAVRAGDASFHWAVIVPFTLAAVASSVAGKRLADRVRPELLTRAFAALLFAVAGYTAITSASALFR